MGKFYDSAKLLSESLDADGYFQELDPNHNIFDFFTFFAVNEDEEKTLLETRLKMIQKQKDKLL